MSSDDESSGASSFEGGSMVTGMMGRYCSASTCGEPTASSRYSPEAAVVMPGLGGLLCLSLRSIGRYERFGVAPCA